MAISLITIRQEMEDDQAGGFWSEVRVDVSSTSTLTRTQARILTRTLIQASAWIRTTSPEGEVRDRFLSGYEVLILISCLRGADDEGIEVGKLPYMPF